LFTPILAIVLFTLAMTLILWTLNYQNKSQQEYTLYRETAYAKQRIQNRFLNNEEKLLELSREISNSANQMRYPDAMLKSATRLIQDSPEILHIRWIDREQNRLWSIPVNASGREWFDRSGSKKIIDEELNRLFTEAVETNKPDYGRILKLKLDTQNNHSAEREAIFWHITPIIQFGNVIGAVAVLYSVKGIVKHTIPSELNGIYRFKLLDAYGQEVAISNLRRTPEKSLEHTVTLDRPSVGLSLHVDSYPPPTNLTYRTLLWLVIGLSAFVLWSLWSVWSESRRRYIVQRELQTETNFRKAMEESMTIGIRAHDMTGRITYVNPAFSKMTGWSKDELVGMEAPFPFWPKEYQAELIKKMQIALQGKAPSTGFEAVMERKDHTRINTRTFVSPLINEKGEQSGWISSIVDISEPIKARQELALAHERFTTVLESLDAAVSVISLQSGQLLFANKYYRENFGNHPKTHLDLAGHEIEPSDVDALDMDGVDGFAGLPASALTPINSDSREVFIDKTKQWFEVRRRYISWIDGHLAQLIVATDISTRKKAEEMARQQEEKMQFSSRLTTMGEMASSLAHELNQPLAAISNYCTGIANRLKSRNDYDIEKDILPAIEKATNQAHRAGTIISRIKGFVKRSQPQSKLVNIQEIIDDSIGLAEIEAQRYGVRFQSIYETNLPQIFADPILLQQVVVNLLKNGTDAVKTIESNLRKLIRIEVRVIETPEGDMLRIQVSDQGPGIPLEIIERLYEPFFSTKTDGMGMGLNICRSIIESHHGRLWVENNATEKDPSRPGCTFTILLPIRN